MVDKSSRCWRLGAGGLEGGWNGESQNQLLLSELKSGEIIQSGHGYGGYLLKSHIDT